MSAESTLEYFCPIFIDYMTRITHIHTHLTHTPYIIHFIKIFIHVKAAIKINGRENIQDIFNDTFYFFTRKKNHRNENRFLTKIYNV